ncbi:unnamed protein product [Phyllotreta striolata]|uniref:CHK kinase-like domain-containing protein n=1 Tax=Phyllotreta striolata TaxID=444603 RepID=A0A9N9XP60_PHYSR|nr:unnamed protein product [Phyllotreta striolata]
MELDDLQTRLIEQVAKENGFDEYEIDLQAAVQKGDNFMGKLLRLKIKNASKTLPMILKIASTNALQRKMQQARTAFLREIYLYDTVFEEFRAFEDQHRISQPFRSHPKFFAECTDELSEMLVLEDMKEKHFRMCDKKLTMNSEHIVAVLEEYAKFHATSLAMRAKNRAKFDHLTAHLTDVFAENMNQTGPEMTHFVKLLFEQLIKSVEGHAEAIEMLEKFEKHALDGGAFKEQFPEGNIVVTHGDCWCNNLLFKYENDEAKTPSNVCIIDWQLSKLGSPGVDLNYFLLANAPPEVLDDYETYLRIYYDVLERKLAEFGCDPQEVFTFDELLDHFHRLGPKMLFMCTMVMRIALSEPDEAPDFANDFEDEKDFAKMIDKDINSMDEFYRRLGCIVRFVAGNNSKIV